MNKRFVRSAVVGLSLVLLAGCGESAAPAPASVSGTTGSAAASAGSPIPAGQTVTIRYDSYNYAAPGLGGKGTQMLIDEFQAKYPNIKIQARNVPSPDILKSTVAQAAAGDPPEVVQLVLNGLDFAVNNLPVQPIDQIAPKDEYADMVKHILPQALKLGQMNGHLYGSPYTFSTPTLFYNADIFKAAGLDPDKPPTTWEQVRLYGQQIKDKTGKAPLYISGLTGFDWLVQSLVNSNGGTTISADKTKATFNQPAAIEVYKWWQGLVNDGIQPKLSDADAGAAFSSGNMAMQLNTTVYLPAASDAAKGKFDLRTAGEPSFGAKPVVPVNSGSALFVMTKDPVKQYASWEFLRFAASQRGNTIITSVIGYVPQRDDVVNDPAYLKPLLDSDPRMLPTINQLVGLQPWVSWPGKSSSQAVDIYMQALQNVVYGGQDPQKTMDAAAARVDALLKEG